jgi:hypothetical protein
VTEAEKGAAPVLAEALRECGQECEALADSVIHLLMNGLNPAEKRDGVLLAMDAIKEQTARLRALAAQAEATEPPRPSEP